MEWNKSKVLVTGGTGFVGSHLVEALLKCGAHVRVCMHTEKKRWLEPLSDAIEWMQGDLLRSSFCRRLVHNCDRIFHLASHHHNVQSHRDRPEEFLTVNLQMSLSLIGALRQEKALPVTFFSTANVPHDVSLLSRSQTEERDGYAIGKALSETEWVKASGQMHFPLLILRPVHLYGPRDRFSKESTVIPSLIVKAKESSDSLRVWGSGKQERAFIFVEDVPRLVLKLIDAGAEGIEYLQPPDSTSIASLAEQIRDLVRPGLPLSFDRSKPEGALHLSPHPLHPSLKDFSWTSLEEGLKKTVEWYETSCKGKEVLALPS